MVKRSRLRIPFQCVSPVRGRMRTKILTGERTSMLNLTISALESHWAENSRRFSALHGPWKSVYGEILKVIGEILEEISGRRRVAENCAHLLLSKSLNHSLSSFALAERGLVIDAALSARNGLESLLLLQLCTLDASESLFQRWSNSESFRPAWVRKELQKLVDIEVRDVHCQPPGPRRHLAASYRWLSEITHANLSSLSDTMRPSGSENTVDETTQAYLAEA